MSTNIDANVKPLLFRAGTTWCLCSGIFLLLPSAAVEIFLALMNLTIDFEIPSGITNTRVTLAAICFRKAASMLDNSARSEMITNCRIYAITLQSRDKSCFFKLELRYRSLSGDLERLSARHVFFLPSSTVRLVSLHLRSALSARTLRIGADPSPALGEIWEKSDKN